MTDRADEIARETIEPTLAVRLDMLSWGSQPLNVIGGQAVDRLVADTKARIAELEAERDQFREKWEAAADAAIRRQGEINRLNEFVTAETAASDRSEDRARQAEAELVAMRDERDRLRNALTKAHARLGPQKDGWGGYPLGKTLFDEIAKALSPPTPEGGGG